MSQGATSSVSVATVTLSSSSAPTYLATPSSMEAASQIPSTLSSTQASSSMEASSTSTASPPSSYSSMSTVSINSLTTASSTPSAVSAVVAQPHHKMSLYFGIAVAAIAVISLVLALTVWFCRTRKRSRALSSSENMDNWPWDPDHDARHLENGARSWDEVSVTEVKYGSSPRGLFELPLGYDLNGNGGVYEPPRNPPNATSYPTVHINAHQSVPDLAPDAGRLQVTNYMPGDISSSDEASRANSRQGAQSEYGSPVLALDSARPRFLTLDGNGLDVPWTVKLSDKSFVDLPELPFPGSTPASAHLTKADNEGWAASIRSNILNAFHAVVGTPSPLHDTFTQVPERRDTHRSIRSQVAELETGETLQRKNTMLSTQSDYGGDLVRLASVHRDGSKDWEDLSLWMSGDGSVVLPEQPPAAVIKTRDRSQPGTMSRTHSGCEVSVHRNDTPRILTPGLISRQSSLSLSRPASPQTRKKTLLQMRKSRKTGRKSRRPPLLSRTSSIYSTLSVGSDMSRNSSISKDPLTEQEKFASLALRERRKRLMSTATDFVES